MSTKQEIFDYVTTTPENTNPAVLRSLLNNLESNGGLPGVLVIIDNNTDLTADGLSFRPRNGNLTYGTGFNDHLQTGDIIIPEYESREDYYTYAVRIGAAADNYTVTVNGNPVTFADYKYTYVYQNGTYPSSCNIVIRPK